MLGHEKILAYFQNCVERDLFSHAYLFLGGRGAGRMSLLKLLLPALVGEKGLASPDFKVIEPTDDYISIEEIRSLRFWLRQSPLSGGKKVAVVKSAPAMGQEAQNAFLKILEEPAPGSIIFLLAGHRRQLLPTIISRAVPIYFPPAPKIIMET